MRTAMDAAVRLKEQLKWLIGLKPTMVSFSLFKYPGPWEVMVEMILHPYPERRQLQTLLCNSMTWSQSSVVLQ